MSAVTLVTALFICGCLECMARQVSSRNSEVDRRRWLSIEEA
jgi:hypothetical protein